jgi:hypothetical protein
MRGPGSAFEDGASLSVLSDVSPYEAGHVQADVKVIVF